MVTLTRILAGFLVVAGCFSVITAALLVAVSYWTAVAVMGGAGIVFVLMGLYYTPRKAVK